MKRTTVDIMVSLGGPTGCSAKYTTIVWLDSNSPNRNICVAIVVSPSYLEYRIIAKLEFTYKRQVGSLVHC